MPTKSTPKDAPITMSPKATPGTVTSSVSPTPSAKEPGFNVHLTAQVSENKPRKESFPRRVTTAEAVAILISPNLV
jgi:hypothetical protein